MKIKNNKYKFIKNRSTNIKFMFRVISIGQNIKFMFPVIPIGQNSNCYLLNVNENILNINENIFIQWFIVGCLLLGIIFIYIWLMANNSTTSDRSLSHNAANEPDNRRYHLSNKLLSQLLHNNANSGQHLNYKNFPSNHTGYLNLEERMRLVSIVRSSIIADQYRYGSSIGNFYIKNTYHHPIITPDIIGIVLHAESVSN